VRPFNFYKGGVEMEKSLLIKNNNYSIPAVFTCPDGTGPFAAVILCHGTGSNKDEVGNMFIQLADLLKEKGIASIRFDFAGCGDSMARQQELSFMGEVSDVRAVHQYLDKEPMLDSRRIGILGFSQGARVMAEYLKERPEMPCAVSWSGACHNGAGIFEGWFKEFYDEARENGYARIALDWREDLLVSKAWFDELESTVPMDGFKNFSGAVLAFSGTADPLVPYLHAEEIVAACKNKQSKAIILPGADHTFNVLSDDKSISFEVLQKTTEWFDSFLR